MQTEKQREWGRLYMRKRRQDPEYRAKDLARVKAYQASERGKQAIALYKQTEAYKETQRKGREAYEQSGKYAQWYEKYKKENGHKKRAQCRAIRKIKDTQPCSIKGCDAVAERHHPDYAKPLDIVWLCRKHHKMVHGKAKGVCTKCNEPMHGRGLCRKHYAQTFREQQNW